jgi:hypothetical protein
VIVLSGVLVVIAIALLVAGIVVGETGGEIANLVDGMTVIYASIAVSIVSFLCLLVGVFLRRKELFRVPASPDGVAAPSRAGKQRQGGREGGTKPEPAAQMLPAPNVPATAVVVVVPGRKRYHIDSCRQLAGRDKQELTFGEAREEGFSPCTACMPDTALAARAVTADTGGRGKTGTATVPTSGAMAPPQGPAQGPTRGSAMPESPSTGAETIGSQETTAATATTTAFGAARPGGRHAAPKGGNGERTGGTGRQGATPAGTATGTVRVLSGTTRYHRPDCTLIEDVAGEGNPNDLESLSVTAAEAKGYTACLVCRPDREPARD